MPPARRLPALLLLASLAACATGCVQSFGPDVPAKLDWQGHTEIAEHLEQIPPDQGRLQIICGYTPPLFSHSAVRLVTPDHGTIFWDPGGDYSQFDGGDTRQKDIVQNPPRLGQYIVFRLDMLGDNGGEIFEWDIDRTTADYLRDALISGRTELDPEGPFTSNTVPSQCAIKVSAYARKFAPQLVGLASTQIYPYDLAQSLWRLQPDRVIVYRKHQPLTVYTRPNPTHP